MMASEAVFLQIIVEKKRNKKNTRRKVFAG